MKEIISPLEKSLAEILNKAMSGIDKGVGFLEAQLPDVVEQLLLWKMWESLAGNALTLLFAFILPLAMVLKNFNKGWGSLENGDVDKHALLLIIGCAWMALGMLPLLIESNLTWLQIWVAPKVYLIEYAAKLVSGN